MPLKCIQGEEEIYAFNIESDEAWEDLRKANAKAKDLRMPCCQAGVVLRTSKLGTKHFAHARLDSCTTAPETAEHLLAKMAIVDAIRETDWAPLPEQAGKTPSGEEWRADVLAVKGKAKVAFEIQWSRQDKAETIRRQKRYDEAGVRGLWLFRQKDFPIGKETPAFRLVFEPETKTFCILFPSAFYHREWVGKTKEDAHYWGQSIPLETFVAGALKGQLRFAPALGMTLPLEVSKAEIPCWRCNELTGIIIGLNFVASRVLPGCPDIPTTIYKLAEQLPKGNEVVMSMLPARLLNSHGIGATKPRYSKTAGHAYMSNGCVHCDAIQGRFYEHDFAYDGKTAFETEVEFKVEWGETLTSAKSHIYKWWFNESNPPTE